MRGAIAKDKVLDKIKEAFGNDFIGEYQKKYYVWADDGGERVQIAVALTCPKTQVETVQTGNYDFTGNTPTTLGASGFDPAAFTVEEEEKAESLMKKLGF